MSQNVEIEYKNLLSEEEYKKLIIAFEFDEQKAFTQENCYFDSEEMILKAHNMALRIRVKQNFAEMTLKSPYQDHLLETNHTLTVKEANHLIELEKINPFGEIADVLKANGIDPTIDLHMITRLKTRRIERQMGNCLLVLDQSWYADQVDFELEVESQTANEGKQFISEMMKKYHIPERITPNKITRAMKASQKRQL
ncbi:CYTH domain-containing protein [Marinilactibacillus kalidii]|uniref:CYTH domain-containing protein n=1 Tax=Marinilactibacillus kalidii TaxID=2820274 RepID=UPI001ABE2622|nr:CYTH domain-containing protein [Marinilactibacillus kalidii]